MTLASEPVTTATAVADVDQWMSAYIDGDASAFAKLFDALGPRVYRYLMRMANDSALAEDLVQTTFLKVHRGAKSFRRGDRVTPWVFAIAQNAFRDELRKRKRSMGDLTGDGELPRTVQAPSDFGSKGMSELIEKALASLSAEQREVVVLHKLEGLSMNDVADTLGISSGAARVRAHRAYKAIAQFVEENAT